MRDVANNAFRFYYFGYDVDKKKEYVFHETVFVVKVKLLEIERVLLI